MDLGGPSAPPVIPVTLPGRGSIVILASFLMANCLVMTNGVGGFITNGIRDLVGYTLQPAVNYFDDPFRKTAVSQA